MTSEVAGGDAQPVRRSQDRAANPRDQFEFVDAGPEPATDFSSAGTGCPLGQGEGSVDEQPVGRRVAYWRSRRKMSQQLFADRLGKSKSWVDKVERGVRRLDRFSVIYEIADVLQLDVQVLMGRDPARRPDSGTCIDQLDVEEIRGALERYDKISTFFVPPGDALPLPELTKAVGHAWLTFQHAKYGVLARMLPKLLRDVQAANVAYTGERGREAARLLGQVYQITSLSLRKLGENDLAWLAADRAIMVCQRAEDDLLAGLAVARVANALAALGRFRPALEINVNIAHHLAPREGYDATPERLSVYGIVLLEGAMAAAGSVTRPRFAIFSSAPRRRPNSLGATRTTTGPTSVPPT